MSMKAISIVLQTEWPSPTDMLVAIAIANYTGPKGECFAFYSTIAKFTGLSEATIGRSVRTMTASGHIESVRNVRNNWSLGGYVLKIKGAADPRYAGHEPKPPIVDNGEGPDMAESHDNEMAPGNVLRRHGAIASNQEESYLPEDSNQVSAGANAPAAVAAGDGFGFIQALNSWNDLAARIGLSVARVNDRRKANIAARLSECGEEGWRRVLLRIEQSKFLRGFAPARAESVAPFKATLDWTIKAANFLKVLEGNYAADMPGADRMGKGEDDIARTLQGILATDCQQTRSMTSRWQQDPQTWPVEAGPPPGAVGCVVPVHVQQIFVRSPEARARLTVAHAEEMDSDKQDAIDAALRPATHIGGEFPGMFE